ncbi:C40 family peptidase [Lacinutrix sp.]|uniref:C40 family peptidase n=1 Tax=Lacinutrix sp. TaxID=1937692 RepID=UPI002621F3CD|nr:C40 family peptidase [Lacinutrix sp.]MDG1715817.1 C40 family peptidase [Lacinutrix sp.]
MRKIALILFIIVTLSSCGSTKNKRVVTRKSQTTKTVKKSNKPTTTAKPSIVESIIKNAEKYEGTRYKYGGTTKKGMDCSGLIYTAFKEDNITIPRVSSAMAKTGDWIDLKNVREGDLLFFATKKNSRSVNHVGLVTAINGDAIAFIHSTTSKGVITSTLKEKYWYFAFVQARRVL